MLVSEPVGSIGVQIGTAPLCPSQSTGILGCNSIKPDSCSRCLGLAVSKWVSRPRLLEADRPALTSMNEFSSRRLDDMTFLILAPCQTVLQDPVAGHSLISVFDEIKIAVPAAAEVPQDAVIPREWCVFSRWMLAPEEEGEIYSEVIEVFWPDNTVFNRTILPAAAPGRRGLIFVAKYTGFPMGQSGRIRIRVSIERRGQTVCGPVETDVTVQLVDAGPGQFGPITEQTGL